MDASRVIVCAPNDSMLFEISPREMWTCNEYEEINGQHYLEITTTRVLEKEQRVVVFDERERAHEYVVASEDKEHANGSMPFGKYKCPWSLQHDAYLWKVSRMVGTENPRSAAFALEAALSGTQRWTVGTVTLDKLAGASMYQMSGWEALTVLVETWGGELDATVTVGLTGVTSRTVSLYAQMGEQTARRRFDYARDVSSISRHIEQDPIACRIIPRGKGEKVNDGYGRKITIEDANDGVEWLQNDEAAELFRLPDGHGGWEYPVVYVDNQDIEDPAELKEWGLSVLNQYTTPNVSYTLNVIYLYQEGVNPYGVDLGDVVQVVDTTFGDTPLRIEARVVSKMTDRLDRSKSSVTVSNFGPQQSLASSISSMGRRIERLTNENAGTTEYLNNLLENINAQINATGGWTYVTRGNGTVTYDRAVSDPLVGSEAHQVTEMKGGTLRFANSKTPQGEWNWTNVITADGYLGLAATIARITTGFIGSAGGGSYWDLDNNELYIGGRSSGQINDGIDATITGTETQYIQTSSRTTPPSQSAEEWSTTHPGWQRDKYIWQRTKTTYGSGDVRYSDPVCTSGVNGENVTILKIEYGTSNSASTQPSSWSTSQPQSISKGSWLWVRTTYSNGSTAVTKAYAGTDGVSVSITRTEYGISSSASSSPSTWSTTAPSSIDKGKWLWVRTTFSDNTVSTSKSYVGTDGSDGKSVIVSDTTKSGKTTTVTLQTLENGVVVGTETLTIVDGEDGPDGINGKNGYVHTAWATSSDGSQGFSTSDSAGKTYLGVYTDNTAADSTRYQDYSWSLIKGADGRGIKTSAVSYGVSGSSSTEPSSWSTTPPSSPSQGQWVWARTITTYTDNTTSTTYNKSYIGTDGQDGVSVTVVSSQKSGKTTTVKLSDGTTMSIVDGNDGSNGTNGKNGYVHTGWANSADGSTDFSTTVSANKKYLGVYTDNTEADSTDYRDYSWSLIKGADGASAYTYSVNCNPAALVRAEGGTLSPSQVTFSATRVQGTGNPSSYSGRFIISEFDGSNWANKYTSSANEASKAYSPTATAKVVRCNLYLAGGTSTLLDTQTVPIVSNGTSVTVSKIEYGVASNASTAPTYSTTVPTSIAKGKWLWVRTTYSDGSTAVNKSYVGTDGEDGTSIYVTSSTKSGGTTTVTLNDGTTMTINDGEDGANGTAGKNGYVHTAWANSSDGSSGFSTTESANKKYLGVYTDNTAADSTDRTKYSWSLIKGSDGTNGTNGTDGKDAYTVMLTNESHTFAGGTSAAVAGSTTSQVIAYKGATQVVATIGTISGAPTGMSVAITNNGKTNAGITVTVTTSLTTRQGVLTIPVTVDGKSFSLQFSWSLALAGTNGVSITGVTEYYARNNSTTAPADSAFGTSVLTPTASERYVWNYESIAYSSGNPTKTAKHIVAVYGDTGAAGRGISGIADYYAINNSTTAPADSAFSTSVKTPTTSNPYLWNYEVISYTTGNPTTTAKRVIGVYGSKGKDGTNGVGMSSIVPEYYLSTSSTSTTGGSWSVTEPLWQSGRYIWQRYHIYWDNNTDTTTDPYYAEALTDAAATAHHADEGAWVEVTGVFVSIEFAVTASGASAPDSVNGNWSVSAMLPKSGERLWKRDVVTTYHGTGETREIRNIESVTTYNANLTEVIGQYYLSSSASSTTGGSWANTCPAWASGKTIWTRARTKVSNQYAYTTSRACAVDSESSATGIAHSAFDRLQDMETGFHVFDDRIQYAIMDAARSATDYIVYENGELTLGATDSAVRNVMTNTRNAYRTAAGDIAYFGLDSDGLWRLFIENASITDMLRFGNFAWIARQNGNMTIKWIG